MVAVRVVGVFSVIRTRTVTEQHQPYRRFTEATQDQQEVTFEDVTGTLAGFRMHQTPVVDRPGFVNVRLNDDGSFPALPGGNSRSEFANGS